MNLALVPEAVGAASCTSSGWRRIDDISSDLGERLDILLRRVPARLARLRRPHPLLRALQRVDSRSASELCVVSAVLHVDADERDVAEYLLRHRGELVNGATSAAQLMRAAARAADCDLRRARSIEAANQELDQLSSTGAGAALVKTPSVSEVVVVLAEEVLGRRLSNEGAHLLADAVVVAMTMGERHRLNGGTGPSLLAMRPGARRPARLVTHLRCELDDTSVARAVSRLLIGGDGAPIESALLWWAAQRRRVVDGVPEITRRRWSRDLDTLEVGASRRPA